MLTVDRLTALSTVAEKSYFNLLLSHVLADQISSVRKMYSCMRGN